MSEPIKFITDHSLAKKEIFINVLEGWEVRELTTDPDFPLMIAPIDYPEGDWVPQIVVISGYYPQIVEPTYITEELVNPGLPEWELKEHQTYDAEPDVPNDPKLIQISGSYKIEQTHFYSVTQLLTWNREEKTYVISCTGTFVAAQIKPHGEDILKMLGSIEIRKNL